ncbi:MAG: zf-HC2 domain-containing protein [Candidatus Eremiobacteraeota bacterium]|nr:zf-HC2 domain-containing protein [Candidatus Eremiobacteraeota bacterium]MBV8498037.1 zf-HC2 domain-containing protein [Candidatus Eremiobacteraeota bacterium]
MNETHPTPEQLVDYVHGELPAQQDAAVHAHLAGCLPCAQAHEAERSLTELLRAHARSAERELPYRVIAGIREAAAGAPGLTGWERIRSAFRPLVLVPVAAALVVALYLGFGARHPATVTPINAAYYVDNHAALTATTPFSEDAPVPAMLTSDDQTR